MKPKKAVALRYQPESSAAPYVVAAGYHELAQRIAELAQEHDVPLVKDSNLAKALMDTKVNQEIPPHLYQAVAEVLAFIYSVDKE